MAKGILAKDKIVPKGYIKRPSAKRMKKIMADCIDNSKDTSVLDGIVNLRILSESLYDSLGKGE